MSKREKEILDFAVAKEVAAERFYLHWAARASDADLKELLRKLAAEERTHIEKLSNTSAESLIAEGLAPAEFGLAEDLPETSAQEATTLLEALAVAIQREEDAVSLYERLRAASTAGEPLFAALVEEERRHKHKLELEYALLNARRSREQRA
jgi:rubrerythrin